MISDPLPFEVTESGFILRDGAVAHEHFDSSVTSIAISRPLEGDRPSRSRRRNLILRFLNCQGQRETICVGETLKAGMRDPLQNFMRRLVVRLSGSARQWVQSGGTFSGEGWSLTLSGLSVRHGERERTYALGTLSSAEWIGHEFCVWSTDEEPILRLPPSSENVIVLSSILPEFLPRTTPRMIEQHELGRLLLELKSDPAYSWNSLFPVLLGAGVLVSLWACGVLSWMAAGFIVGVFGLVSLACRPQPGDAVACFDRGLLLRSRGQRLIPVSDLKSIRVRSEQNRAKLQLQFRDHSPAIDLSFRQLSVPARAKFEKIEETLSKGLATHMLKDLVECGAVAWTPEIQISVEGLKIFRNGQVERIPFFQFGESIIDDEEVNLMSQVTGRPLVKLARQEPNALSGWLLMENVRHVVSEVSLQAAARAAQARLETCV
ncbi:hypothetical protein [Planctomicrobium sp. SH664]|uniref:hypothetical protein n=1 Tax=Planctomicrobium sp. SH664 TaxID=3448125 RepID=UPI003F5C6A40